MLEKIITVTYKFMRWIYRRLPLSESTRLRVKHHLHGMKEEQNSELISLDLHALANSELGVNLVHYMATSGEGTDECLENDCLPVAVNFFQPIPNLKELERRGVWDRVSPLSGVKMDDDVFLKALEDLSEYADECVWPIEKVEDPMEFHLNNGAFAYGCAAATHCIIRKFKPKRIIEVGSGNSSKVIAAAVKANKIDDIEYTCEYTIIDPYTEVDVSLFPKGTNIHKEPVETMAFDMFKLLCENDLLFIDSSHVCKIGSDVNYLFLDILPLLSKGVFVHIHDISLPYEYGKVYATNKHFRMFWTEAYLLQAFLAFNNAFEVYLPMQYIMKRYPEQLQEFFPKGNAGSVSFWIRKIE